MSSVRMCDKCKTVFSELDEGWQTYTATTLQYDEDDRAKPITQYMDMCPACAVTPIKKRSKAAIQASEQERRIRELEEKVGMNSETGQFETKVPDA